MSWACSESKYDFVTVSGMIIRLEARLQPNIGNTLMVFTRSRITPPKLNRFG